MAISADLQSYIYSEYTTLNKFRIHLENVFEGREEKFADKSQLPMNYKSAGVLFPLLISKELQEDNLPIEDIITDHIYLILEKRSEKMKHHPGDLAFPGGTREIKDVSLKATAYREAQEEMGIDPNDLEFISCMDEFVSSSKILVKPVISWLYSDFNQSNLVEDAKSFYSPKTEESEATVVIPISHLLDPEYYTSRPYHQNGKKVGYVRYFNVDPYLRNNHIWGLTATMIRRFLNLSFPKNNLPTENLPKNH